ncbi:hypothetical protein HanXRQr2_Chr06g0253811 [Helianthus annuus]|uniref:Uncharacterized protein n=1 Tax=Helianthus annuus TaxID=4232 RepID=A0A9K3IRU5_HELAN|nr:hypothetical protein HanXRQr2_Chr06g0253811 [Helianthus annuus]KAJ0915003.1 hypothetical protein HanPSC8_Chr06g0245011 [Helianthus annuus]
MKFTYAHEKVKATRMPKDFHHDSWCMYVTRMNSRVIFKNRHGRTHSTNNRIDSYHLNILL